MRPGTSRSLLLKDVEGTYDVFLPPQYEPSRSWPVVLALHPAQTPPKAMIRWLRAGAERHGWILVAPAARSQRWLDPDARVILAALEDASKRWTLDADRVCLAGYSSGAFMASRWGFSEHERFAALFLHAGVQLFGDPTAAKDTPLMMSCGEEDAMLADMKKAREELEKKGFTIAWKTWPGMEHHETTEEVWDGAYAFFRETLSVPAALLARAERAREQGRWRDAVLALDDLRTQDPDRRTLRRAATETKLLEREGSDLVKKHLKGAKRDAEATRRALEDLARAFEGLEAAAKARAALETMKGD